MRRIYIATHGEMSLGIKDSLKLIAGDSADDIQTYSLIPGENAIDFIQEVDRKRTEKIFSVRFLLKFRSY
ncbi:hypothetical protein [Enterococcus sp. AZ196]|uniref:PTS sugar transporter subunit IIA domain-containing protein n=1 Tax=Enterococcus sp. AZ196 TaxID=2774659 RepID=UPI003D2AAB34